MKRMLIASALIGFCLAASGLSAKEDNASNLRAVIKLAKGGEIVIKFYPQDAPKSVANFIKLARKGFYNGLTFHRLVPGFVAQGGDPNGDGSGGPGYTIQGEFSENGWNNQQKHVKGAVAMARTNDPNSAGSQFYICLDAQPALDGKYAVFGQVVKGMEYVDQIQIGDKIEKISILGGTPKKPVAKPTMESAPANTSATPTDSGAKN